MMNTDRPGNVVNPAQLTLSTPVESAGGLWMFAIRYSNMKAMPEVVKLLALACDAPRET